MPDLAPPDGEADFYFVPARDPEEAVARIVELVSRRIPRRFGLNPIKDIQVLCPMNRGGVGARSLLLRGRSHLCSGRFCLLEARRHGILDLGLFFLEDALGFMEQLIAVAAEQFVLLPGARQQTGQAGTDGSGCSAEEQRFAVKALRDGAAAFTKAACCAVLRIHGTAAGIIDAAPGFFAEAFGPFAQPVMKAAGAVADAILPVMRLLAQPLGHAAQFGTATRAPVRAVRGSSRTPSTASRGRHRLDADIARAVGIGAGGADTIWFRRPVPFAAAAAGTVIHHSVGGIIAAAEDQPGQAHPRQRKRHRVRTRRVAGSIGPFGSVLAELVGQAAGKAVQR